MPDSARRSDSATRSDSARRSERLLRWLVGGRDADAVAGDLRETGANGWSYWRQALSCLRVRLSPHRRMIPDLGTDLRMAVRNIRRNPGYALTAMLCLGLAMGVNATLFSFLDSVYFRRLPVPESSRVVNIRRDRTPACTWQEYLEFRNSVRSMETLAFVPEGTYVDIDRVNLLLPLEAVSANYARVLRLGTTLGRWFTPEEDSAGTEAVMVVSHHLWVSELHSDPAVLGRIVRIHEQTYRIVGVALPGFRGVLTPLTVDGWIPMAGITYGPAEKIAGARVNLIGRLAPDATLAAAGAEMRVIDARLETTSDPLHVEPAAGFLWTNGKRYVQPVISTLGAVCAMVLLIACVNVANLLLGRAAVRRREMAVRRALGAGRGRLYREALTDGLVLAAGGVLFGIFFGYWTGRALEVALPSIPVDAYKGIAFGIDWRVATLLGAAGAACAILFSLPAAVENGNRGVNDVLRGEADGRPSRQREIYSVAQVALSLALLIATGLALRALQRVETADPGFARDHRLSVNLFASPKTYSPQEGVLMYNGLLERARRIPGVLDATLAFGPLGPAPAECLSASPLAPARRVAGNLVEPNYFAMMTVPILKGRGFIAGGAIGDAPDIVVTETMARNWWPGEDVLGKTLWIGCGASQRSRGQVTGVARDTRPALDANVPAAYYLSRRQWPGNGNLALIVRTAGDPYQWVKPLMQVVESAGPNLRIYEIQSLADADAVSYWSVKWQAALVSGLGILAILLAAIGLYGVVAYAVSQRTREIGVRMALGAAPGDVQWMVLAHGLRITAIGVAVGLALCVATVRLLRGYLYGLSPFDPVAFGGACLAWIAIAMLASWLPARRATRVDPLVALKWE
jgi:putative ABC transport system permease protein